MGLPRITAANLAAIMACAFLCAADGALAATAATSGATAAAAATSGRAAAPSGPPATIKVGNLTLSLCNTDYTGYCGSIRRPIDPAGAVSGQITVGFEYYPRTDSAHSRLGTILPQEGGPGYSSTGTRDFYLSFVRRLAGPSRRTHRRQARHRTVESDRLHGFADGLHRSRRSRGPVPSSWEPRPGITAPTTRRVTSSPCSMPWPSMRWISTATATAPSWDRFLRASIRISCAASSWTAPIPCVRRIHGSPLIGRLPGPELT